MERNLFCKGNQYYASAHESDARLILWVHNGYQIYWRPIHRYRTRLFVTYCVYGDPPGNVNVFDACSKLVTHVYTDDAGPSPLPSMGNLHGV